MEKFLNDMHPMRIKLIYNPASGANKASANIIDIIKEMQEWNLIPELYLTDPGSDYALIVKEAMDQGIETFAVCGGDGTVSSVARALVGTSATLAIIPAGTQNNVALSMGIPRDISEAIAILRRGRRIKSDMGFVTCNDNTMPFLEVCSVGLFTALFQSGDGIQHGDITRIGDFLSIFNTAEPSKIHLQLDNMHEIQDLGYVVLIANMPYIGRNYNVGSLDSYSDGLLDVLFCADIPKADLMIGYMLKLPGIADMDDSRIMHFKVRNVVINANPPMPIMADGIQLDKGPVRIGVKKHALWILTGPIEPNTIAEKGEGIEN